MADEYKKYKDQYGRSTPLKFKDKEYSGGRPVEMISMSEFSKISHFAPFEPYMDKATQEAVQPFYLAGGTLEDGVFVADGTETSIRMVGPEKSGKWEYWNMDTAGGVRNFLTQPKYEMPNDYKKDELCIIGAGRGTLGFYLGDTGLNSDYAHKVNNGLFKNVTMVEDDQELVDWQKYIINKHGITNIKALFNSSIEEPETGTDDWDTFRTKQYDMMIATLPFCDRIEGNYYLKQQIRQMENAMENFVPEGQDWPFTRAQRDYYTSVAKFENKCYDENFGRHRYLFKNAHKYLKIGGYLITVHNSMASDIDTFKPMIEEGGLDMVHHSLIDKGIGSGTETRHFFARTTLIANISDATKYVIVCKKK